MAWHDEYPHKVYANVVLIDNKIFLWKVGRKMESPWDMTIYGKLPAGFDRATLEVTSFEVNNGQEHNTAFEKLAPKWYKQWEMHFEAAGSSPY